MKYQLKLMNLKIFYFFSKFFNVGHSKTFYILIDFILIPRISIQYLKNFIFMEGMFFWLNLQVIFCEF